MLSKLFFSPAVALMNRLRLSAKMVLVGVLITLTVSVLGGVVVSERLDAVRQIASERVGIRYVAASMKLVGAVQQHRGLSTAMLSGDETLRQKVLDKGAEVDRNFAALLALAREHEDLLQVRSLLDDQAARWAEIKRSLGTHTPKENLASHTALVEDLLGTARGAADRSGLGLDGHADTSLMQSLLVNDLPPLTEVSGITRARASSLMAKKSATQQELIALGGLLGTASQNGRQIDNALARMKPYLAPAVHAHLGGLVAQLGTQIQQAHAAIDEQVFGQKFAMPAAQMFELTTRPIAAANELMQALEDTLELGLDRHLARTRAELIGAGLAAIGGVAVVVYLLVGLYLGLRHGVHLALQGGRQLAEGNLGVRVHIESRDEMREIGDAFNGMADSLRAVIGTIKESVGQVGEVSSSVAAAAAQVSQSSGVQSESAASMAASMEEMSVSIQSVADNAAAVDNVAEESLAVARRGNEATAEMVGEITEVESVVGEIASSACAFADSARAISQMTQEVRDIAEQTNLLALNAAIEAARAGEQGRGFAVVADEVRKLAEKSAKAAAEIDRVTQTLTTRSASMETVVGRSLETIRKTLDGVEKVAEVLAETNRSVEQSRHGVGDISASVREQTAASHDLARNLESIAQMSEENSSAIAQLADHARHLREMARALEAPVGKFRL